MPLNLCVEPNLPYNDTRRWGLQKLIRSLGDAFMNGNRDLLRGLRKQNFPFSSCEYRARCFHPWTTARCPFLDFLCSELSAIMSVHHSLTGSCYWSWNWQGWARSVFQNGQVVMMLKERHLWNVTVWGCGPLWIGFCFFWQKGCDQSSDVEGWRFFFYERCFPDIFLMLCVKSW